MAEMYDNTTTTTNTCSTSLPSRPTIESDDISLFLHHLLHSSSSSPSPFISERTKQMAFSPPLFSSGSQFKTLSQDHNRPSQSTLIPDSNHRFSDPTSTSNSSAFIISSSELKESGDCDAVTVSVKRRKLPSENNDLDDFDCESEEGFELSEGSSKAVPPRNSSKRSRAAEVHNLSEKRRRSRINEKMRALQNLIPNSNKTDKASMLDEAIEYLKQLQLQVQMLSMRNGLSLHSTHLPGVMHPLQLPEVRMGFGEGNGFLPHINMGTDTLPVNQESSTRTSFGLSNQCTASHQAMVIPSVKNITNSETSYGLDLPIQVPFHPQPREEILPQRQLHINHSSRNLSEIKMKTMASESLPYDALASFLDTTSHVERSGLHRERSQDMLTKDVDNNQILIQHLHSLQTGGSVTNDSKIKTLDF